jgi:nucleoside-diphosphate-sugar epimerase
LEKRGFSVETLDARKPRPPRLPADYLFHLAGMADASKCEADPKAAHEANVALTGRMLDYCRRHRVGVFVLPSTAHVYGTALERPARETDAPRPGGAYVKTKLAAEALLAKACARGRLAGAAARLANVYGPGVSAATVAGTVLAQLRKGREPKVRDLTPARDFLFVDDAAEGLIRLGLAARPGKCLVVNVGTGKGVSVARLVETARRAAGRRPRAIKAAKGSSLVLDDRRLARLTRWTPPTSLRRGLSACLAPYAKKS